MVPENQATSAPARYDVHVREFTVPSLLMMGTVSRILIVSDAPTRPLARPLLAHLRLLPS